MLGLSFGHKYMTFVAITEEGDSRVIEQTGLIEYSAPLTRNDVESEDAFPLFNLMFKELKHHLDFPQKEVLVSISADFATLFIVQSEAGMDENQMIEKHLWETNLHFGDDYSRSRYKIRRIQKNEGEPQSVLGIYYHKVLLDAIKEAAISNHFSILEINIGNHSAVDTIRSVYDLSSPAFKKFSTLYLTADTIEYSHYENDLLIGYFIASNSPNTTLPTYQTGKCNNKVIDLILSRKYDKELLTLSGPVFVYATKDTIAEQFKVIKKVDFMEWIDPFQNYKSIFKRYDAFENAPKLWTDNLFTETAGALFKGLANG